MRPGQTINRIARIISRPFLKYGISVCIIFSLSVFLAAGVSFAAVNNQKEKKNPLIEAAAAVDKATLQIGDKITYTITVKANKNIEVEFPHIVPENLSGFAIKDFGSTARGWFGKKTFKQWYILDTYVSGQHVIPATVVKYRKKGQSDWQELAVNEVKLDVKSILDNSPERGDIRDIRGPKSFAGKMLHYAAIILAAILITGAIFWGILLRKKKKELKNSIIPAHVIAYEALSALEKKDYIRTGQTKAFYIELSDIVRHYLENRFNIRAPEMTTEEFLSKVKEDSSLSIEHKGLLRDFLATCDLVKFARYQPVEKRLTLPLHRQEN